MTVSVHHKYLVAFPITTVTLEFTNPSVTPSFLLTEGTPNTIAVSSTAYSTDAKFDALPIIAGLSRLTVNATNAILYVLKLQYKDNNFELMVYFIYICTKFDVFMKSILEYYDNVNSVCSFWRGRGVLSELERNGDVRLKLSNWKEDWSEIRRHNIAFFQRPMSEFCLQQVCMCKDLGLKVWMDFDDYMYIPDKHPMAGVYNEMFNPSVFRKTLLLADVISVTNNEMAMSYAMFENGIKNKISVIPNAINDNMFRFNGVGKKKYVVWRGGEHRLNDIKPYLDDIEAVMSDHSDWFFLCVGDYDLDLDIKNYEYLGNFNIHDYFALMLNLNPAIIINPLEISKFNKCKSNIVWQEATMFGAVTVSPEWSDYQCGFRYSVFKESLIEAMENESSREEFFSESSKEIKKYLLSNVNELRKSIIDE